MSTFRSHLACILAFSSAAVSAQSSLPVGYYPAEGSGTDITASHHTATVPSLGAGVAPYEAGKSGQAFSFDGSIKYLDVGNWFEQQSFTIAFWMKDNATAGSPQVDGSLVAGQHDNLQGTDFWDVKYVAAGGGHYEVETNNGGASIPFAISQGTWHYVLLTRNVLNLRVFVDGLLQGSSSGTSQDTLDFNGGIRLGGNRNLDRMWKGALDELRFYDRALKTDEIAGLSKSGLDIPVAGTANPYLAGQPNGTTADGDSAPAQAPVAIAVQGLHDLLISASGAVGTSGGTADGPPAGGADLSHLSANGIAAYAGPGGALVGVFLGDAAPSGPAPDGLDYSANGLANPANQNNSPEIGQVFFIGDRQGTSGSGHFYAPEFATRLFLGVIDIGNSNNTGSFSVHIVDTTAGGPFRRTITGKSNIHAAGSTAPPVDGIAPPSVTLKAAAGQVLTFTGVSGGVRIDMESDNGGNGSNGPDGGAYQGPVDVAAVGGVSGFKASTTGALAGVFLAGDPASATPPATLDFTAANAADFTELSPLTGQVFFIGDGLTPDGKPQKFHVPENATGLHLGIADGSSIGGAPGGFANNDGQFEADFQIAGASDTGPPPVAELAISATAVSTGDPVHGLTAQIGDDITYTFHWDNSGNAKGQHLQVSATIPTYIEDTTNLRKQFAQAALTFNQYGHYFDATSESSNDAKIVWDVADLEPGFSQEVALGIHLHNQVRNVQQIGLPNDYKIASTTQQPATSATGFSSGAANLSTDIRSALRFTATPDVTNVAPGKYINYTLKLENKSHVDVATAAAVFTIPEFTRFVGFGIKGAVPVTDPAGDATGALAPHPGGDDEVLIYFGNIAALASASVTVTVQAQWVAPSEVSGQKLVLSDFGAAFLNGTGDAEFRAALKAPGSTSYYNLIKNPGNSTGLTYGGDGAVTTTIQGSTANGPDIRFTKAIMNEANATLNDGLGNTVDIVHPFDVVTYAFLIANLGKSAAEDVYIQDAMPSSTTYVNKSGSAWITNASGSVKVDTLQVVPEVLPGPGSGTHPGQHLVFKGLRLAPKDFITLQYQVKVGTPAIGSILTTDAALDPATGLLAASSAGTSSSPHTVSGLSLNGPLEVGGKVVFAQPRVRPMLPNPEVSLNAASTKTALDAVYASNKDAKPLTNPKDPLSFIPGVERFYIHYENLSSGIVSNVDLVVPLPSHTAFYRACFVTLDPNPQKGADGIWPGKIDKIVPKSSTVSTPKVLSTGGKVTAHFDSLKIGEQGDLLVEVIITPDAIKIEGPFTGAVGDSEVVIHDNPVATKANPHPLVHSANVGFPRVKVAHRAAAKTVAAASGALSEKTGVPTVPEIGVFKIAPTVVNAGGNVEFTFVIFNSGNTNTPACNFQFFQPACTAFLSETHTTSYNGTFIVDGPDSGPGVNLECFWDYIPPHAAVAVTYTLSAAGPANIPITDLQDRVVMNYAGELGVTPSQVGVVAANAPGLASDPSTFSVTGHTLHQFKVKGVPVGIIDLGNGKVVVDEPVQMYKPLGSGVEEIAFGRTRGVFVGPAKSIGLGATSAAFLTTNRTRGALLAPFGSMPVTTIVPAACLEPVQPGQLAMAAGAGQLGIPSSANVISNDGASLISQDGGGLISQDGGGLISQDGASLITNDGGSLITNDGGSLIDKSGSGITAQANTVAIVATGGGNIVASGGGNIVATGGGN